jgi:hypothetical protein
VSAGGQLGANFTLVLVLYRPCSEGNNDACEFALLGLEVEELVFDEADTFNDGSEILSVLYK